MNRASVLLIYVVLGVVLSRCTTRTIDIELPQGGGRPVLLGLLSVDDSVDVFVGRTAPVRGLPPANVYVRDAVVQVMAGRQVVASRGRYVGGGMYRLRREQSLQIGQSYRVAATAPNWGTYTSQPDTLPAPVAVTGFTSKSGSCTLVFNDPPGRHYYVVSVELYKGNERVFDVPHLMLTFTDELFDGKTHQVTVSPASFATHYATDDKATVINATSARIRLLSVSRRTHTFFANIDEYDLSSGSAGIEPTSPLSGIPGGFGYFGVGNSSTVHTHTFN